MKKLISMFIAAVMAMSMSACSNMSANEVQPPADVSVNEPERGAQKEPAQDNVQVPKEEVQENFAVATGTATIEETVLVEEAGVKVTAKSLNSKALFGAELKLLIENNSGKDLVFQCRNASVNGYMIGTVMSVDVANGKKANDELIFVSSDLELCGIETIADMEFSFHIFDASDWKTYLDTQPIQLCTSVAAGYMQNWNDIGDEVYNANGLRIVTKGLAEKDSVLGPSLVVYVENNSNQGITVQARDESINGFMIDSVMSVDVAAGKKAIDTITFSESAMKENGITDIKTVELYFHIFEAESWEAIVDTEIIHLEL